MESLRLDEIEALRVSVNAESQLFPLAGASHATNKHQLSTTLTPSSLNPENTTFVQSCNNSVEQTQAGRPLQNDWISKAIIQR